ncbi:ABC transporter ATP-binding protein [Bordetella pertussis]|nr:ABC transporter ATP-binding protein [Bordetella pertussis]
MAIVGASGAGKSTVLQLLLRLEDPQRGAVRYAGCDVRECAQAELHRRVALLSWARWCVACRTASIRG